MIWDHKRPKFGTLRCRKNSVEMTYLDIKLFSNKSSDGSKIKYASVPEKFEFPQFICSKQVKYWICSDGSRIWTSNIGSYAMTSISNGDLLSWLGFELAIGSRKTIKIFCRCKLRSLVVRAVYEIMALFIFIVTNFENSWFIRIKFVQKCRPGK